MTTQADLGPGRWVPDKDMHPATNVAGRAYAAADGSIHWATQFPIAAFGPAPALWFFPDSKEPKT